MGKPFKACGKIALGFLVAPTIAAACRCAVFLARRAAELTTPLSTHCAAALRVNLVYSSDSSFPRRGYQGYRSLRTPERSGTQRSRNQQLLFVLLYVSFFSESDVYCLLRRSWCLLHFMSLSERIFQKLETNWPLWHHE